MHPNDQLFTTLNVGDTVLWRCGAVGDTIPCFREYFLERIESDPEFKEAVESLRGKRLGCFCAPGACHGDVIVEYLEGK